MAVELREVYESELRLQESKSRVGVLGVVEGVFFVPESPSRNGRIYPKQLWERVLNSPDVRRLLINRLMIGTVGHDDVDFDALIREQKVSHVVTDLWLGEDGKGYGRAEILDTPVGRILYTLLKSGSRLAVSSKGWGEYKSTTKDGLYVVDESSYVLERFDFVVDPGFLEAVPGLKKQYESVVSGKVINSSDNDVKNDIKRMRQGGEKMEVVEVLVKEKAMLQEKVNELLVRVKELEDEKKKLETELQETVKKLRAVQQEKFSELKEVSERWLGVSEGKEILKEIELLGKLIEEEAEKLVRRGVSKEMLEGKTLSEVLAKVFLEMKNMLRRDGRDREEVRSAVDRKIVVDLAEFAKLRYEKRKLEKLLVEARRKLAIVESLGGVEKIVQALKVSEGMLKKIFEKELNKRAEKLSLRYGVGLEEAKRMILRMGYNEAENSLKKMKKVAVYESVERVKDVGEIKETKETVFDKNLAERLVEKLGV